MKVIHSAHELFTEAVRKALPEQRFLPAQLASRNVRQLVQIVYRFSVQGMPFTDTTAVSSGSVHTLEVVIVVPKP